MTITGDMPITAYLVISPGRQQPVLTLLQSREVAEVLIASGESRAFRLNCTLASLIDAGGVLTELVVRP